jgi:hypothetical protein
MRVAVVPVGFLALFLLAETSYADYHLYHDSSPLSLGAGFDPSTPLEAFRRCVDFDGPVALDTAGAIQSRFSLDLVTSQQSLYEQLNMSASVSAQYAFFVSGGAGGAFDSESALARDSVTWIISLSSDYGRFEMINPHLKGEAQALITSNQTAEFARRCGTHVVLQERRGASLAAVFTIHNLTQSRRESLTASFQAGGSYGLFSGSVAATYRSFLSEAVRAGTVSVKVFAIGGDGVKLLSGLVKVTDDLAALQAVLQNYAKTNLGAGNATAMSYTSGTMSAFGWLGSPKDIKLRDHVLVQLHDLFAATRANANRLQQIIRAYSDPNSGFHAILTEADIIRLTADYDAHGQFLTVIRQLATDCRGNDAKCQLPSSSSYPKDVSWPAV